MNAYKAYDIRGVYGRDFDASDVEKIGFFLPTLLKTDRVLVGRDARVSSPEIFEALCKGITAAGADVFSIGLATTPTVYFATATHGFDAAVQITASHNPPQYNGLKISKTGALPVDYLDGLAELETMCAEQEMIPATTPGRIHTLDVRDDYIDFLKPYCPDLTKLRIGIDCSNGMAALLARRVFGDTPQFIFEEINGTFPNHPPNPLIEENCADMQQLVINQQLDIGLVFDGDADRVVFIDEKGQFIQPDRIIAVLAEYYLKEETGIVLHDVRTSKAVDERIHELGGTPHMWKVGHSFAKRKMRELGCIVGGELAGHYYFRDFFNCDSGMLAALIVLSVAEDLRQQGRPFSSCIDNVMRYPNTGELNFKIQDKAAATEAIIQAVTKEEAPSARHDFDGVRLEFPTWWCSVRCSQTESYLRLLIEADTEEILKTKRALIENVLKKFG